MRQTGWLNEDGTLGYDLYYTDNLHLIEGGNEKLASSITDIIDKIERREKIADSSDEEEEETTGHHHGFERKYGERRRETPRSENNFVIDNPFKLTRRSSERRRERSLSPCRSDLQQLSSTSQKRLRTESSLNEDDDSEDRYTARRKLMRMSDNSSRMTSYSSEKTDSKPELTTPPPPRTRRISDRSSTGSTSSSKELVDDPLKGVVKSIDITQTDAERLAARRAKFSAGPLGGGSSLRRLSESSKAEVRGSDSDGAPRKVSLSREKVDAIVKSLGE